MSASVLTVMNSTIASSIAAGVSDQMAAYFHVHDQAELVLPTSMFLIGYVVGPLMWGPLSEQYGRRPIQAISFLLFTAFSLGSALVRTYSGLVVMRLLTGIGAACAISVVGG